MNNTRQRLVFLSLTFLAMILWPMLGIAASSSMFAKPTEAVLLFGGISGILLLPIYVVATPSESAYGVMILVVWLLIWLVPSLWLTSRPANRRSQITLAAVLSAISFAQAALGLLMILGKNV